MKINFQFTHDQTAWLLFRNGKVYKGYPKNRFSKPEAEDKISDHVNKAIKKYGWENVEYNGCFVNA